MESFRRLFSIVRDRSIHAVVKDALWRKRRRSAVSPNARLALERLETRECPSFTYNYSIIAQTGQAGLTGIEQGASINDSGKVAFVGDLPQGQGVFVGDGTTLTNIDAGSESSNRVPGTELQINNNNQVAFGLRIAEGTALTLAEVWSGATNTITTLARGTSPRLRSTDFDGVGTFVSISNDGNVALAGLNGTTWEIHQTPSAINRGDSPSLINTLPSSTFFRQMSADNSRVVVGSRSSSAKRIVLFDHSGTLATQTIATTAGSSWSDLGVRPGISDDGQIVAFYGNLTASGASALNSAQPGFDALQPGPGIFASMPTGPLLANRVIVRVAGIAGDGKLDPGETFIDVNGTGVFGPGDIDVGPFSAFNVDDRVAVNSTASDQAGVTLAFLATGINGKEGLYTSRLDYVYKDGLPQDHASMPTNFHVQSHSLVAQLGDQIPGLAGHVQSLAINDPINNNDGGQVAFWVATDASTDAIVRATPGDPGPIQVKVAPPVNLGHLAFNQFEGTIAIDPLDPSKIFAAASTDFWHGLFASVSTNGGMTFVSRLMADGKDGLPLALSDERAVWDRFGNLFLCYVDNTTNNVVLVESEDGGLTFGNAVIVGSSTAIADQPKMAVGNVGPDSVIWICYTDSSTETVMARGAMVTGANLAPVFSGPAQALPGSSGGRVTLTTIAVGPTGQVLVAYQKGGPDEGPNPLFAQLDAAGLGGSFTSPPKQITSSQVGVIDVIPANFAPPFVGISSNYPHTGIRTEAGLAWDDSGGKHNGRVYLVYTNEVGPEANSNTDIHLRYSDNDGMTWSDPLLINDDATTRSQFWPAIAVDQTTGNVAVTFYDARNDPANRPGDPDNTPNNDVQYFGAASFDGGLTFSPNVDISGDFTNSKSSYSGNSLGDYTGVAFQNGAIFPIWSDNGNTGTGNKDAPYLDVYTSRITIKSSPVAVNDNAATTVNFPIGINVLANDTDVDGVIDPSTVTIVSGPSHGMVSVNTSTGQVTYTPTMGYIGPDSFKYVVRDSNGLFSNTATVTLTVNPPVTLSPDSLPLGTVDVDYEQAITASNGTGTKMLTFTVTGGMIPSGLGFIPAPNQLLISGIPTVTGSVSFDVTATDAVGAMTVQSYTVTISFPGHPPLTLSPASLPAGTAGMAYNQTIIASGGIRPFTFAVTSGSLPTGLMLNASSGVISGTPTSTAGSPFTFTITATDSASDQGSRKYTVTINPGVGTKYLVTVVGPSTVQAGSSFLVAVQATDALGNPVSSYLGPSRAMATLSPGTAASNFPTTVSLNGQGLGLFLANVRQVGSYSITVTGGSFTGTSSPVAVTPGPAVTLAFVMQPVNTPVGVPLSAVTVQVEDAFGNVVTADNTDTVVVSVASGPGPFLSGNTAAAIVHNGVATFRNLTFGVPGSYTLGAQVPFQFTGPVSNAFTIAPLQVASGAFAASAAGFSLQFNVPFLVNAMTPVLYGQGFGASAPLPSVTLTQIKDASGHAVNNPIAGSLILNTATNGFTFLATDTALEVNTGSPLLPDGTYQVDVSGSAATNGFQAQNGGLLDGTNSGIAGSGDFVTTFTVSAAAAHDDVLWIPATADGPGQPLNAPGNNQLNSGYPIYLNDQTGAVSDVQVTLNYDPSLLTVTGVSGANFSLLGTFTPGQAVLHYSGPTLPAGSQVPIGVVRATVPSGTLANPMPYGVDDLLHLSGVALNGGAVPVVTADALHLVAYVGDADGNAAYSSNDAVLITRVALQTDSGFAAYSLVDPVIVADTDGAGFIPADAALQVNEAGVGFATANLSIPPIPPGVVIISMGPGPDPGIEPRRAAAALTSTVPVHLHIVHLQGETRPSAWHLARGNNPHPSLAADAIWLELAADLPARTL